MSQEPVIQIADRRNLNLIIANALPQQLVSAPPHTDVAKHDLVARRFFAQNGQPGGKNNCSGRSGRDTILLVPTGTVVIDEATGDVIADLKEEGEETVAAMGGKGGLGLSLIHI